MAQNSCCLKFLSRQGVFSAPLGVFRSISDRDFPSLLVPSGYCPSFPFVFFLIFYSFRPPVLILPVVFPYLFSVLLNSALLRWFFPFPAPVVKSLVTLLRSFHAFSSSQEIVFFMRNVRLESRVPPPFGFFKTPRVSFLFLLNFFLLFYLLFFLLRVHPLLKSFPFDFQSKWSLILDQIFSFEMVYPSACFPLAILWSLPPMPHLAIQISPLVITSFSPERFRPPSGSKTLRFSPLKISLIPHLFLISAPFFPFFFSLLLDCLFCSSASLVC